MPAPAQLKPKRSRGHARRVSKHPSQFFRVKKCPAAVLTGATRYEFSSIHDSNPTHIVRYTWDQGQIGYLSNTISSTSYYQSPINWAISYDNRNRITGFNRPSAQASYSYDANSNRLSAINKKVSDSDLDGDFDQADKAQTIAQSQNIDSSSNQLLGFTQTTTGTKGDRTLAITTSQVSYALDAAGNMTTDGLRTFSYNSANRHNQTTVTKDGEASKITYLHNANGQRVFKSEPQAEQYQPNEAVLGTDFIAWLKKNFSWLFATAQANATLGQSYVYADTASQLPGYALLGEYSNGGASSSGRLEYIWLPTESDGSGDAVPIGLYRTGKFYAVHSDHLNTPRKITDETNKLVWQWPYSAFGDNKPTGILKATANPNNAYTQDPTTNARLQATTPAITFNLRMPGQYFDFETGLFYNTYRSYNAGQGRYTQNDPIGLDGGLNRYAYVGGNPLSFTDPLGLQAVVPGPGGIPVPIVLPPGGNYPSPDFDPWRDTRPEVRIPGIDPRVPQRGRTPNDPDGPGACRRMYESCLQAATSKMCPAPLKVPAIGVCTAALVGCIAILGD